VIPTAYHAAKYGNGKGDFAGAMNDGLISDLDERAQRGLLVISRGTAVLLLGVYVAYLIFQLKTHASLFVARKRRWILFGDDAVRAQMNTLAAGLG
jgi:Ca2+:H+ antiporter